MTNNYRFVAVRIIRPLLFNNVENFAEGIRSEVFQNTADARIEVKGSTATQNFWWMGKLEDPLLYWKIVFSDEANFWLNGYVNKQNCRFWSEDQSEALQKLPMRQGNVTVRCGLWTGGIIGPYFFRDAANHNVTVNGDRYREMISNICLPKMQEIDLHYM